MRTNIETPGRFEPCFLEEPSEQIIDAMTAVDRAAAGLLGQKLHPRSAASLAGVVRVMNCYYSNLIEGHNTTLRDIERALQDDFDTSEPKRNLQLEARSHIEVQRWIDRLHGQGILPEPASSGFIKTLHRRFYRRATPEMLIIEENGLKCEMRPGQFRGDTDFDVRVGRHLPPSGYAVEAFMSHFETRYRSTDLGLSRQILAMAAAHHRFNYIHPFLDGNGRVSRLMSHAMGLRAGIGAHGLWSISRGLARGWPGEEDGKGQYKRMMNHADMPRQEDLDGRGNLSERALADFTLWFLRVCLDQITFMSNLFEFNKLLQRLSLYVERRGFRPEAFHLLKQVVLEGEIPRGEADRLTNLPERTARDLLASLIVDGILDSDTPKGPVSLRFPSSTVEILFPALYPEHG